MKWKCRGLAALAVLMVSLTCRASELMSLELRQANLPDAIRSVAKFMQMNVILSPSVHGLATLSLHEVKSSVALDALLAVHGLAYRQYGNVIYVASQRELIKQQQDALKLQSMEKEAATLISKIWQIRYAKAEDIAHVLLDGHASMLSKRGRVRVDPRTNTLCIQDDAESIEKLQRIVHYLDVPVRQISIKARLASVDYDYERQLGIQFEVKGFGKVYTDASRAKSLPRKEGSYGLAIARLADGELLDVKLSALENAGHAELISSPQLFTANQQTALIEAGEEVPYQEVSESGGTAVVFKKAVLGLKVTPQALPGHRVLLQLEINQDRPSNKLVQGVPTISTRKMFTSIVVSDGQTVALGGIYEANSEKGEQGLPFLSHIPVLGLLFKQQNIRENKRELLIFVTPTIVM